MRTESQQEDDLILAHEHGMTTVQAEDAGLYPPTCPTCGGDGTDLGTLGRLAWYRCRQCGMDFSQARAADHTGDRFDA